MLLWAVLLFQLGSLTCSLIPARGLDLMSLSSSRLAKEVLRTVAILHESFFYETFGKIPLKAMW
jgi:hypothetical protein